MGLVKKLKIANVRDGKDFHIFDSATYGKRHIKLLGELSIVDETLSFCMMVCDVRKLKRV